MYINQIPGNKPDQMAVNIRNGEASASIGVGVPVILLMNGTNDGVDVVLPSSSSALKAKGLKYGVNTRSLGTGDYGAAVIFGYTPSLLLYRQTRGNSTDVWASEAARSVGEFLSIQTTLNGFVTQASTIQVVTNATTDTIGLAVEPAAVLAQTLALYASSASSTADSRTAITVLVKAMIRMM